MTAITAVRKWSEFIYRLGSTREPGCDPTQTPVEDLGNGILRWTATDTYCVTTTITSNPNGSYRLEVINPNGTRETLDAVGSDFYFQNPDRLPQTVTIDHRFNNGDRASYVGTIEITEEFGQPYVLSEQYQGSLLLRKSKPVQFSLTRSNDFSAPPDEFRAEFPGGTVVSLLIPFSAPESSPDFSLPTLGQISLKGKTLEFQLHYEEDSDLPPQWNRLTVGPLENAGPGVLNGRFVLGPDYSGRGQMLRGRKLDFVARWGDTQTALVILPNGQATSAGPAAGTIHFALLRWNGLASAFGPAPGQ
jgi:hypothetical protein